MNKNQLGIFKTLLFIFGFGIVVAAFFLVNYPLPEEGLSVAQKFFWADLFICYFVFFLPFFFSSISHRNIDTKITSTVHIWICVVIFEFVSIILAVLVLKEVCPIKAAVLIELILFFVCGIFVYFGYFAGTHIGSVQAEEAASLSKINELKSAFSMLNLKTDMWSSDLYEQKTKVKKLCDDVKYMSPVDTDQAQAIETKLIIAANVIAESTMTPADLDAKIMELTNLVNQRKLMRR